MTDPAQNQPVAPAMNLPWRIQVEGDGHIYIVDHKGNDVADITMASAEQGDEEHAALIVSSVNRSQQYERMEKALRWIANWSREAMENARTLQFDMQGMAESALPPTDKS